jgi:hypothetical protein
MTKSQGFMIIGILWFILAEIQMGSFRAVLSATAGLVFICISLWKSDHEHPI